MNEKLPLLFMLPLLLASCGKPPAEPQDYLIPLPVFAEKDRARVLQVTDMHWTAGTDFARETAYLDRLMERTKPDLIVASGDNVMLGSSYVVDAWIRALDALCEKHGAHFMTTFGNHDRQGSFHPDYWREAFAKSKRGLYREFTQRPKMYGKSNYAVSLTDGKSEKPLWNVFAIDSNTYRQANTMDFEYDVIHEDQIAWYEAACEYSDNAPNLVYCHIPLYEVEYAFRLAGNEGGTLGENTGRPLESKTAGSLGRFSGVMKEKDVVRNETLGEARISCGYDRTKMFEEIENHNGRGVFFGHDHANSFCAEYSLKENNPAPNVTIGFGLKTGDGLYYEPGMIGGTLAEISKDGSVEYFRCYQGYEEGDYVQEAMFQ